MIFQNLWTALKIFNCLFFPLPKNFNIHNALLILVPSIFWANCPWVGIQKYGSLIGFCIVKNLYINWDIWVHGKKVYIVNLHILQKLVENGQNLAFKCGFSKKQKWKMFQCFFVTPTCLHYPHSVHDFAFSWINILVIPTNQSD